MAQRFCWVVNLQFTDERTFLALAWPGCAKADQVTHSVDNFVEMCRQNCQQPASNLRFYELMNF
jgi:hypothetical protein